MQNQLSFEDQYLLYIFCSNADISFFVVHILLGDCYRFGEANELRVYFCLLYIVDFLDQAIHSGLKRWERNRLKLCNFTEVIVLEYEVMWRCEDEGRGNEESVPFECYCGGILGRWRYFGLDPSDVVVGEVRRC
jgi:hypothetical protein